MPSQLRDQRLLSHESSPTQTRDSSLSASLSESVIHLISPCQRVEECLLSRANCITQSDDLSILSPAISAYSAARSVSVSRLRSTCQPVDQHLSAPLISAYQPLDQHQSTTLSAPVSRWISACQTIEHHLISCVISAYSAALSVTVRQFISTGQSLGHGYQPIDRYL